MIGLHLRMTLLLGVLFAIVYAVAVVLGTAMGVQSFAFYIVVSLVLMGVQYALGPKIIEWSMGVRYVERSERPRLYAVVEDQAARAGIPMPRVGVSASPVPNAFAFGRGTADGRICVTEGILRLLSEEELRAVIGHEVTHLKNRDVLTITLLSVIPMVLYRLAWHFLFFGDRRREGGNAALIGLAAFLFYFVTNLLVLYASRIREYFADRGSVALGNRPEVLATALYKLVYGAARTPKAALQQVEGARPFFLNDPARARSEIRELRDLDLDHNGRIDPEELEAFRGQEVSLSFAERWMEAFSTHPNMLKRIRALSTLRSDGGAA